MYLRMGNERDMSEGMWLGRLPAPRMGDIGGVGGVRPGPSPDTERRVVSASTTAAWLPLYRASHTASTEEPH